MHIPHTTCSITFDATEFIDQKVVFSFFSVEIDTEEISGKAQRQSLDRPFTFQCMQTNLTLLRDGIDGWVP